MTRRVLHLAAFVVVVAVLLALGVTVIAEAVGAVLSGAFVCVLYGFILGSAAHGYFVSVIMRPRPRHRHECMRPPGHRPSCICACGALVVTQ